MSKQRTTIIGVLIGFVVLALFAGLIHKQVDKNKKYKTVETNISESFVIHSITDLDKHPDVKKYFIACGCYDKLEKELNNNDSRSSLPQETVSKIEKRYKLVRPNPSITIRVERASNNTITLINLTGDSFSELIIPSISYEER